MLEHFFLLFVQIAQMGLILPRWGLTLPCVPPPTPFLYSAVTNPFHGYVRTQNTPKTTPKHHFSWPELESGQKNYRLGKTDPNWAKSFEKWVKLSRSGQKQFIYHVSVFWQRSARDGEVRACLPAISCQTVGRASRGYNARKAGANPTPLALRGCCDGCVASGTQAVGSSPSAWRPCAAGRGEPQTRPVAVPGRHVEEVCSLRSLAKEDGSYGHWKRWAAWELAVSALLAGAGCQLLPPCTRLAC